MTGHMPYIVSSYAVALIIMGAIAVMSYQRMRTLRNQVEQLRNLRRAKRSERP